MLLYVGYAMVVLVLFAFVMRGSVTLQIATIRAREAELETQLRSSKRAYQEEV